MSLDVRLAYFPLPVVNTALAPTVRLAMSGTMTTKLGKDTLAAAADAPALLVSFVYLAQFLKVQERLRYRDWVFDSGAFSAFKSGTPIDIVQYMETCKQLLSTDPTLTEVFALDVIGDWKGTMRNTERMWAENIPAIPCFHVNEPDSYLIEIARRYPKIALGGVALARGKKKLAWAERCFGLVWPKKIHGFGYGGREAIMALPWHSVDVTNWEIGPCAFGRWASFGAMSIRGSKQDLRAEVEHYLKIEREARSRWRREMALLDTESGPAVRLALNGPRMSAGTTEKAIGE